MVSKQSMLVDIHRIADEAELDNEPLLGFAIVLVRKSEVAQHYDFAPGCQDELADGLADASTDVRSAEDEEDSSS